MASVSQSACVSEPTDNISRLISTTNLSRPAAVTPAVHDERGRN
jgi:hypothetical protein